MSGIRFLLCDDEEELTTLIREYLDSIYKGSSFSVCSNAYEAIEKVDSESFDIIISDKDMMTKEKKKTSGLDIYLHIREFTKEMPFILVSGTEEIEPIQQYCIDKYFRFVSKPFDLDEIENIINLFLQNKHC